jgi:general secretion pathway protein A
MYRQYYNMRLSPFSIEPDPDFLWLGEKHLEGLATLHYAILENKGFLLLTGDVGTGKTVLLHHLKKNLPGQVKVATIADPGIEILDLYRILSSDFQSSSCFHGKADFLIQFKKFLHNAYTSQNQLLIIIDEAHRLSCELLDEIRMLSNIDYEDRQLINIFFVGQIEFNSILMDERNKAVRQRIAVSYHLIPLDEHETHAYVRHRLKVAGSEKDLFTPGAVREIYKLSGGTPRLINVICDRALLTGYLKELRQIETDTIRECATELEATLGIPAPAAERVPEIDSKFEKSDAPERLSKRNTPWLLAALVGSLCIILYLALSIGPTENNRSREPALAQEQATGNLLPATRKSPAEKQAPKNPDALVAKPTKLSSDSDAAKATTESVQSALTQKEKIDRTTIVIRKRDSWEKMLVGETESIIAGKKAVPAETFQIDENSASESVSASQSAPSKEQRFYVFFKQGSAELENTSIDVMMRVSQLLLAHPGSRIALTSFSDSMARTGYHSKLLALRANCVKSFFTSQGLGARLTVLESISTNRSEGSRPPEVSNMDSWSEIRFITGNEG